MLVISYSNDLPSIYIYIYTVNISEYSVQDDIKYIFLQIRE